MALLFCDSFDHYDTAHILAKYQTNNSCVIESGSGRSGAALLAEGGCSVLRAVATSTTLIVGFAISPYDLSENGVIAAFYDGYYWQTQLRLQPDGSLLVTGPGGNLVTGPSGSVPAESYTYVEWKTVFDPENGSTEIRVNGVSVGQVSSVNTSSTGSSTASSVLLEGPNNSYAYFDDLYICNDSGTQNTDFLGDISVELSVPNGDGRVNTWTATGGTGDNYTAVDEIPPDDDSSYVSSDTVSAEDLYTASSIGSPANVLAVQLVALARKDDAGTRVLSLGYGDGTTESFDSGTSIGNDYGFVTRPLDTNPLTSAPWAPGDLATAQIGVEIVS